ncbi:hypothetical protein HNQ91_003065 [Filimonas zeae]|uniref:Uncharacterized protein n=1 Tax=Filimonas zeae TaxID=1737353 RepID=A0A917MYJ0_9BACT|nr:hypothetical protein [Filimonas zeae]MDR6340000.1 hypothetical protein [Filimonas zeae]GGH70667.1 hypothetical protein GCM10011379_29180 [Filimonas zeae]
MAKIKNFGDMPIEELNNQVANGARFVIFQYTVSIVVATFKRPTNIYYIPAGEKAIKYGAKYSVLSAVLGWWGLPWGPIYTIGSLGTNFKGKDITQEVVAQFNNRQ